MIWWRQLKELILNNSIETFKYYVYTIVYMKRVNQRFTLALFENGKQKAQSKKKN